MSVRIAIYFTCLFLGGCASSPTKPSLPPSAREFHTAPEAMKATHKIVCGARINGLGTAYSASYLVTAFHVVENCASIAWEGKDGKGGPLIVVKFDRKQDWAILVSQERTFDYWARINKQEPENGERLWSFIFLPGGNFFPVSGHYIARDTNDDQHILGTSHPGSSGSGIFNGDGELVGIVAGNYGYGAAVNRTLYGSLIGRIFDGS